MGVVLEGESARSIVLSPDDARVSGLQMLRNVAVQLRAIGDSQRGRPAIAPLVSPRRGR